MDAETAKKAIVEYMTADDEFEEVEITFFGGEPMLEFSLIKELVEWFIQIKWQKRFVFFITTNGTILTKEIKEWLRKHKDYVVAGFSIDGNRKAHNMVRNESYDLLEKNIPFFLECWPDQPAKMTIGKENLPFLAESVIELESKGLYFSANIVFEDIWGNPEEKERLLSVYEDQLHVLVDFYSKRPDLFPVYPILTRTIEIYGQLNKSKSFHFDSECTRFCGAGHEMVMIDVDGESYPCHRFAPWVTKKSSTKEPVNRQSQWEGPEKCLSCKLISACPTCAGFNWEINGTTGIRTIYHCEAYKLEFLASAKLHAIRLGEFAIEKIKELPEKELGLEKARLETILSLIQEGV